MSVSQDLRFAFDVQGYLHLHKALTEAEIAEYQSWMDHAEKADVYALNADNLDGMKHQLNRPVSRLFDADPRFGCFLDHPVVQPHLIEFLGDGYQHIDNDLYFTYPGYSGGRWHRGVRPHPTGHVVNGKFICPMIKVFYCMTDVGPGEGEFVVIPGSHKAHFEIDFDRLDLPAQYSFDTVKTGDLIIFNEALIHNGRPNLSSKTRKTVSVNFGRRDAGTWPGYAPTAKTLEAVTASQHEILRNSVSVWKEPEL